MAEHDGVDAHDDDNRKQEDNVQSSIRRCASHIPQAPAMTTATYASVMRTDAMISNQSGE